MESRAARRLRRVVRSAPIRGGLAGVFAALALLACAHGPAAPRPGTGTLWGQVELAPREGVTPGGGHGGAYGDRRLRDVTFVDYSHPGFAVVFLDRGESRGGSARVELRESHGVVRLVPPHAAVGTGGDLVVANETGVDHVLSVPAAGLLRRLAPGETLSVSTAEPGVRSLFVLDSPEARAHVFVAAGPYAVVSEQGRWELRDLVPGPANLRAWHPRFPTTRRNVDVIPDAAVRVDLVITVAGLPAGDDDAHAH